jgi:uncharacterized protein YceK
MGPGLLLLVPLMLAGGCASVTHQTVPKELISEATVPDMPHVRAWGDTYSTGALIAPLAFLGSAYDTTLQEFYTSITTKDIYAEVIRAS